MKIIIAVHHLVYQQNLKLIGLIGLVYCCCFLLKEFKAFTSKEKEIKKIQEELNDLQEESKKDAEALATAQQHFNAVSAGLSSNDSGQGTSLADQMMTCKNEISKAATEAKQVRVRVLLMHCWKNL